MNGGGESVAMGLGVADWAMLALYAAVLIVSGVLISRRKRTDTGDFFLARRSMPVWAVAISIIATGLSATTFIGAPAESYAGDLTYLSTNIGQILGALFVAAFFIPVFYRHNVTTAYELLETRFGPNARLATSLAYLGGRVFAAGARVFMAAIPASIILFGDLEPRHLALAVTLFMIVGVCYTLLGGIAGVIWTDVVQTVVFLGAALVAFFILLGRIPIGVGEIVDMLREPLGSPPAEPGANSGAEAASKLRLIDFGLDVHRPFTLIAALTGWVLFFIAAYGTDHDLAQRTLTCKSAVKGSRSILAAIVLGLPVTALFMAMGLLLFIFYARPDVMGAAGPGYEIDDSRQVFLTFILNELPAGLPGLMFAGLFAAGLSTVNSSLNAMAAALTNDVYRRAVPQRDERHYLLAGRGAVILWGVVVGTFAVLCIYWQQASNDTLLAFALRVMGFAYAGLLGVFFTAFFTKRGNEMSVIAALVTSFATVLAFQPVFWSLWAAPIAERLDWDGWTNPPAVPWQIMAGTAAAMAACCAGRGRA